MVGQTHLSDSEASVWVLDGWNTTVGVDAEVWLLLELSEGSDLVGVRNTKLLKEDGDLPWVWALCFCLAVCFFVSMEMGSELTAATV